MSFKGRGKGLGLRIGVPVRSGSNPQPLPIPQALPVPQPLPLPLPPDPSGNGTPQAVAQAPPSQVTPGAGSQNSASFQARNPITVFTPREDVMLEDLERLQPPLGFGSGGRVYKVRHRKTGKVGGARA